MRQRPLSRRTHVHAMIAPALIACLLAAGAGRSQETPDYFRWDLMMIEEAPIWRHLLAYQRFVYPYSGEEWEQIKEAYQTILRESPESRWANDAALCLAGGRASFEHDPEGAIAELRQLIAHSPDGSAVVMYWTPMRGCVLDEFWLANRQVVSLGLDGSMKGFPFDGHGDIGYQHREILAWFDLLEREPIRTRDVAGLTMAWIYLSQGEVASAMAALESLIYTGTPPTHWCKADREAAAGEDGYPLRYGAEYLGGVGPFWRPQHLGASTLSALYFDEGDIEKGVTFSLEWASAISPDGWAWGQNATIADRLAQHGYWEEAVVQYQLALKGIRQEIVDKSARWERLYEMGDIIGLPPNFTSWEESFETAFRETIDQIEEALARAESHLPF